MKDLFAAKRRKIQRISTTDTPDGFPQKETKETKGDAFLAVLFLRSLRWLLFKDPFGQFTLLPSVGLFCPAKFIYIGVC